MNQQINKKLLKRSVLPSSIFTIACVLRWRYGPYVRLRTYMEADIIEGREGCLSPSLKYLASLLVDVAKSIIKSHVAA